MESKQTISITLGYAGENHVGMEMIGNKQMAGDGFTCDELMALCDAYNGEFISMSRGAGIAIFRNWVSTDDHSAIMSELLSFDWDDKYFDTRRNRVLNKHARTNVILLDGISQDPDYENKKGRIVDAQTLPTFSNVKNNLISMLGQIIGEDRVSGLVCEGNNYSDNTKCGIGFHGDTERRKVIALRFGAPMSMIWQWFQHSVPLEEKKYEFVLNGGDMYIMSEIAVGTNWKKRNIPTLRHAAGCEKYTNVKPKISKQVN